MDRVPHLVRNSTVGNLLINSCTSVEDKNSTKPSRAEPVAFLLELLGDGRQGNNQHQNRAFTQGRI